MTQNEFNDRMDTILAIFFIVLFLVFFITSGYLFYFSDCETVKRFWTVMQMPGRCL